MFNELPPHLSRKLIFVRFLTPQLFRLSMEMQKQMSRIAVSRARSAVRPSSRKRSLAKQATLK